MRVKVENCTFLGKPSVKVLICEACDNWVVTAKDNVATQAAFNELVIDAIASHMLEELGDLEGFEDAD